LLVFNYIGNQTSCNEDCRALDVGASEYRLPPGASEISYATAQTARLGPLGNSTDPSPASVD